MHTWPAPHVPVIPGHGRALRLHHEPAGQLLTTGGPSRGVAAVCGITPVRGTHLGHLATYIAFDLVVRTWLDAGLEVTTLQHVADVDEALLASAGESWSAVAHDELATFALDMTSLGVIPPDHYVGTAESVPAAIAAVEQLLADDAAYRVPAPDAAGEGCFDIYASAALDQHFGSLSDAYAGSGSAQPAGGQSDEVPDGVRDPLDQALWRAQRPGEPAWDSETLGRGRPSRHLVCAAAIRDRLGGRSDILGGGRNLLVPHHETCVSHLRVLTGSQRPVQRLVHTAMVTSDGAPMGAGPGGAVVVADLLEQGVAPTAIRLLVLSHHYRTPWEFRPRDLEAATLRLERWTAAVSGNGGPPTEDLVAQVRDSLARDLDAPAALAAIDTWADLALSYGQPGGIVDDDIEEGAPGIAARAVDALLGVRL